ncbi:hypothetical protein [Aliiruegeria sabulilitoris]|uniref:hypothetical protein n=1 Tax=Aliiruegeria sabulilitoris TaxID=1510458 RepID=UPI0012E3A71B|nr:hypothetical protein [Aliiruegeria sabulilitoris]NDR59219.1 hypothetical protein [Pseudoruegeria sp. M32A2M]
MARVERPENGPCYVIYQIHMDYPEGRLTYTGRTTCKLSAIRNRACREVDRLLRGVPSTRSHHSRAIHIASAAALIEGWPMAFEVKAYTDSRQEAIDLEHRFKAEIPAETSLNGMGSAKLLKACRLVIAEHLQRQGMENHRIRSALNLEKLPEQSHHYARPMAEPPLARASKPERASSRRTEG